MADDENTISHKIARKLVSHDNEIRENNLKVVASWFSSRSKKLSELELMKIWKGLYYCMWLSDKPFVQLDLAKRLAELIHAFPKPHEALLFIKTFYKTLEREWIHIDILRLDKYLALLRNCVEQTFVLLQRLDWKQSLVEKYIKILKVGPLAETSSNEGLRADMCRIYLQALTSTLTKQLSADTFLLLLEPFILLATADTTHRTLKLFDNIFVALTNLGKKLVGIFLGTI